MYLSSRSKNAAFKQVLGAVAILNDKNGTTTEDIFFVLDSLHDKKVQRRAVQSALRIGLKKGLLTCLDNRYKVRRKKKQVERRKASQVHKFVNKRLKHSKITKSRVLQSCARLRRHKRQNQLDGNGIPVRNFEKACYNNGTDSDISSADTHISQAGSEPEPMREKTKRSTEEKCPEMNNTANFIKSLPSESFKQNSIKPSGNGRAECGRKNYRRVKAANEHKKGVNRAGTSAGVNTVSKKLPVDLERCKAQAKQPRYNLRPRTRFRPQELPSYLKQESRRRVKQEMDKKGSGSDNDGDNNLLS